MGPIILARELWDTAYLPGVSAAPSHATCKLNVHSPLFYRTVRIWKESVPPLFCPNVCMEKQCIALFPILYLLIVIRWEKRVYHWTILERKTSRSEKFYRTVCSVYDYSHVYHLCRAGKESQKDEDLSELVNKHIGIGIVRVKDWHYLTGSCWVCTPGWTPCLVPMWFKVQCPILIHSYVSCLFGCNIGIIYQGPTRMPSFRVCSPGCVHMESLFWYPCGLKFSAQFLSIVM